MAKRLISFNELDDIEGLVEHYRKVQERIKAVEADAAQYDTPVQGTLELSRKANDLKRNFITLLGRILARATN